LNPSWSRFPLLLSFEAAREGESADRQWCAVSESLCEQTDCQLALRVAEEKMAKLNCDVITHRSCLQKRGRSYVMEKRYGQMLLRFEALDAECKLQGYALLTVGKREQILRLERYEA
jgi:hypothetical protein